MEDGSIIVDVTLTSNEVDRDGELVRPMGVKGLDTAVICYNHKRCDGVPVSTGASFVKDSIIQNEQELRAQVLIKTTDQMYFCDITGKKQSNGSLLEAIKNKEVINSSIGYRFSPADVSKEYINGQLITVYNTAILDELSLLDVISSNIKSKIHYKMSKTKCLDCIRSNGGVGSYVVSGDGKTIAKVTEINDKEIKAIDFDGKEIILDDSYEMVEAPIPHNETKIIETTKPESETKVCGCQLNKDKPATKDMMTESEIDPVDPEEMLEDIKLETVLENQTAIMGMLTDLMSKVTSLESQMQADSNMDAAETVKQITDEVIKSVNKTVAGALNSQIVNTKFVKTTEVPNPESFQITENQSQETQSEKENKTHSYALRV